jgi:hypothetical protein
MRIPGTEGAMTPQYFSRKFVRPAVPLIAIECACSGGSENMKKQTVVIIVIGLALFGFVAAKMSWSDIAREFHAVVTALPILLALSAVRMALQTSAWSSALRTHGIAANTTNLIGARLASKGMGYLSGLGPVVSEPMRISLLEDRSREATAATLIDTSVYWVSSWFFMIFGTVFAVHLMSGGRRVWSLVTLAPLVIGAAFLVLRRKPVLPGLVRALGKRCPSWLREGEKVEAAIRDFQGRHPACIRRMFALGIACQILMSAELFAIFLALRIPCHPGTILGLETASHLVEAAGGWLPARVGADESGMAAACLTFGLSSLTGLAIALARRVRDLTETVAGLCWLALRSRSAQRRVRGRSQLVPTTCA